MPENRSDRKVTLEDLLRLKAAERPPESFWADFEREFKSRQLAAAVEKRRWWYGLPKAFTGLARYQLPIGATAVLAVTFLVVREYREPGLEASHTPIVAQQLEPVDVADELRETMTDLPYPAVRDEEFVVAAVPSAPARSVPVAAKPVVPDSGGVLPMSPLSSERLNPSSPDDAFSPSAHSIAANLEEAGDEAAGFANILGRDNTLTTRSAAVREPLAEVVSPREMRRERLLGAVTVQTVAHQTQEAEVSPVRERLTSRLSEEQLYDTVRRISAGGDRFTLKF